MKYRYSKFTGEDLDDVDLEDLLSRLSDLLLSSGFDNPYGLPYEDDEPGHSMQALHDAILEAILNGGMLSDETLERLLGKDWQSADDAEQRLDDLISKIIEKLQSQGYLTGAPSESGAPGETGGDQGGRGEANARFEITDKSLDFLGYRALRDLLGSIGKSSIGRHDTRELVPENGPLVHSASIETVIRAADAAGGNGEDHRRGLGRGVGNGLDDEAPVS